MSTTTTPTKPGYREFIAKKDDKTLIRLSVRHPTKKEVEASDMEYSGIYNRMLLSGLPTQSKMLRELRENEVITPKDEEEMGQLAQDLRVLDKKILTLQPKEGEKPSEDYTKAQGERLSKNQRLNLLNREIETMVAHTADSKAGESQRNFLIACVIERVDGDNKGERLYEDVDALTSEQDGSLLNRVVYEYMHCQQNIPSEWDEIMKTLEPTPEQADEKPPTNEAVVNAVNDVTIPPATPPAPSSDEPKIEIPAA